MTHEKSLRTLMNYAYHIGRSGAYMLQMYDTIEEKQAMERG